MSHLRHIALTVEQDDPASFHWVTTESTGDPVVYDQELGTSKESYPTWIKALDAGRQALKELFEEELEQGPQANGEDESGHPVGTFK